MPDRLTLTNGARADDTLAEGQCRRGAGHGELWRRHDAHVPHGLRLLVSHRRGRYGHVGLIMVFAGTPMYGHYLDAQRR
jgi:hypothetical protein